MQYLFGWYTLKNTYQVGVQELCIFSGLNGGTLSIALFGPKIRYLVIEEVYIPVQYSHRGDDLNLVDAGRGDNFNMTDDYRCDNFKLVVYSLSDSLKYDMISLYLDLKLMMALASCTGVMLFKGAHVGIPLCVNEISYVNQISSKVLCILFDSS